ncbi:MAG TPA: hypothetical protein VFE77_03790 [Rhodanobacter sp.]|nr:hypothetical protein [Rhodanobacter sp.]
MNNRYQAGESQGALQPGSHDQVLHNKLGVTTPEDMAELELMLLQKLYEAVLADVIAQRSTYAGAFENLAPALVGQCLRMGRRRAVGQHEQGWFPFCRCCADSTSVDAV